jgi:hypothetical protein
MNDKTLLLRHVHPNFITEGRITSCVFKPTPKDNAKLSVYNGDLITPEESWRHYSIQLKSAGVVAVSVSECTHQNLKTFHDGIPYQEHAVIDFSDLSKGQLTTKAKILREHAEKRGWLYTPDVR